MSLPLQLSKKKTLCLFRHKVTKNMTSRDKLAQLAKKKNDTPQNIIMMLTRVNLPTQDAACEAITNLTMLVI